MTPDRPTRATLQEVRAAVEKVPDPEIPVLTLGDLGIVRAVRENPDGTIEIDLTPTYSGCPATEVIAADVARAVTKLGHTPQVRTVLTPAWTTDWISEAGRTKLREYGIAPPGTKTQTGPTPVTIGLTPPTPPPTCPRCTSSNTTEQARFGSTPCKSLWRCETCREPFDYFKPH